MGNSIFSQGQFYNEESAYEYVESCLWPNGPVCPHCGTTERIGKLQGKTTRIGLYKCYSCKKPFTVKMGTIFEDSHIPLHKWVQAIYLICSTKKGISANQLHRTLGITPKSACFLSHRIQEAIRGSDLFSAQKVALSSPMKLLSETCRASKQEKNTLTKINSYCPTTELQALQEV
jgi:transposase-like protein